MPNPLLTALLALPDGHTTALPADARFAEASHRWSRAEIDGLVFALAARRPLLVRGEPGSGKSQLARAVGALVAGTELLVQVIHPRFEALDLLYRFDHLRRLTDAQRGAQVDSLADYIDRGVMWRAYAALNEGRPAVVLIDEIDKADADIPNALLEVLGNRSFDVAPTKETVHAPGGEPPLVIVTTNEERELPSAFLRRCAVLALSPPLPREEFIAWLLARGQVHAHLQVCAAACSDAAEQIARDRADGLAVAGARVGLAEYIDLLTALNELTSSLSGAARDEAQMHWLQRIARYVLRKHDPDAAGQEVVDRQDSRPAEEH